MNAGEVLGQPAPHTLRGAETNFYADSGEQSADFELHGQEIHLEAHPVQYEWNYGDGARGGPFLFPGGPLQEGEWGTKTDTSHIFEETGDFAVGLTVTYRATYTVNGGVVIDVPGDAAFSAEPVTISVWRSVVNNFADNCLENPNGAGC
ncbi:PKD domain-containing protein [Arthrobacter sp. SF27]|nr:PKD domain-containing protein [Arthrobacter sp. SF27]